MGANQKEFVGTTNVYETLRTIPWQQMARPLSKKAKELCQKGNQRYNYGNMKPRIELWGIDTGYSTTGFGFGMCD
jgi:hypothetical protein